MLVAHSKIICARKENMAKVYCNAFFRREFVSVFDPERIPYRGLLSALHAERIYFLTRLISIIKIKLILQKLALSTVSKQKLMCRYDMANDATATRSNHMSETNNKLT